MIELNEQFYFFLLKFIEEVEQEAYASERDNNYIENRLMFTGWLKYV